MANVLVQDSSLTAIGNAIREKNGSSTTYKPAEMAAAISSIVTSKFQYKNIGYAAVRNTGGYFSSKFEVPDNLTSVD